VDVADPRIVVVEVRPTKNPSYAEETVVDALVATRVVEVRFVIVAVTAESVVATAFVNRPKVAKREVDVAFVVVALVAITPVSVASPEVLLYVNAALPPKIPPSLNCTCEFDPAGFPAPPPILSDEVDTSEKLPAPSPIRSCP
jgi:hypothetical protein